MRRAALVLLALHLAGCTAPPGPAPTVEVPGPGVATTGPAEVPAWQAEWDRTLAAAKQEGRIVVAGPPGEAWRRVLMSFEAEFPEIEVDYTASTTDDFFSRLRQERQSGVFAWDVRVGSVDAEAYRARDDGLLAPVRPMIFHEAALDDSRWAGGIDGLFGFEKEHQWFAGFLVRVAPTAWVNRGTVPADQLNSARDLLDEQWRGKIVILDPRQESGLGVFTLLLDAYGDSFLRDLVRRQEPAVTADAREQSDWIIRGEYPVGVGYTTDLARRFLLEGMIVQVQPVPDGPIGISSGDGTIQAMSRPPHPNVLKLFANWLLTPTIQDRVAQTVGANSRRVDVFAGDPLLRVDPRFLDQLVCYVCEDMLPMRAAAFRLARELIP